MKRRPFFGDRRVRRHGDPSGLAVAERARERGKVREPDPAPERAEIAVWVVVDAAGATKLRDEIGTMLDGNAAVSAFGITERNP